MLALTIGGAILGYWVMVGITHAVLSQVWKPVKAVSDHWMEELRVDRVNEDREVIRCLSAALWPAAAVGVCLVGVVSCSNKWTARALEARKPQAGLPEARTVTSD